MTSIPGLGEHPQYSARREGRRQAEVHQPGRQARGERGGERLHHLHCGGRPRPHCGVVQRIQGSLCGAQVSTAFSMIYQTEPWFRLLCCIQVQVLDQWRGQHHHPGLPRVQGGRRRRLQSCAAERPWRGGVRLQVLRHRGGRDGLQGHAHEEESEAEEDCCQDYRVAGGR